MNDTLIISLLAFIGSLIPIMTIVIKVNSTLTKLNLTIQVLTKQMENSQEDREKIHDTLNNHETRITILEKRRK